MTYLDHYEAWAETTDYPAVRSVLHEQYRALPDEDIEALFESAGLSADDMELNLGRAFRDVGNAIVSVAPAVLPVAGTVVGTAFGGPLGGALGGALGQAAGGAIGAATRPRPRGRPPVRPMPPRGLPATSPAAMGAVPPQLASLGGSGAAVQLLQLLNRPELLQGLQSMALGALGTRSVPVGGSAAPPAAFANLISTLANQAVAEHHALVADSAEHGMPAYLLNEAGEAVVDVGDSAERAAHLLRMLESSVPVEALAWADSAEDYESDEDFESDEGEWEALWEALDA